MKAAYHAVPKHKCGTDYMRTNHEMARKPSVDFEYPVNYCPMCRLYSFISDDEIIRHIPPFETHDSQEMKEYISGLIEKGKISSASG
jgi:hypothetical protein